MKKEPVAKYCLMKKISKREMRAIFKEHHLQLGFPVGATCGAEVTDWLLYQNFYRYADSNLRKFVDIISSEYGDRYRTERSSVSDTVLVLPVGGAA